MENKKQLSCKINLAAFDIARWGKDELYNIAKAKFNEVGLDLDILEMKLTPIEIEGDNVVYNCIPTHYISNIKAQKELGNKS